MEQHHAFHHRWRVARARPPPIDPDLIALINKQLEQLRRNYDRNLEDIVSFLIVEPGNSQREIKTALGLSILKNPAPRHA